MVGRLQEAIQSAADQASNAANSSSSSSSTASDRDRGPSAKHLKPIVTAVEMVFGSAAALSATFGFKVLCLHSFFLCCVLTAHLTLLSALYQLLLSMPAHTLSVQAKFKLALVVYHLPKCCMLTGIEPCAL